MGITGDTYGMSQEATIKYKRKSKQQASLQDRRVIAHESYAYKKQNCPGNDRPR
jgi:hypothetical protein